MRRGLVLLVVALVGCAESKPVPIAPGYPCHDDATMRALGTCEGSKPTDAPSAASAPPAATAPANVVAEKPPAATLPPPKPTSIALARTGDAKLDALLAPGDAAFEAGDFAQAETAYDAARKAFPKRAAGAVGVARARVAKAAPNLGYASAEKNKDVLAAAKDLAAAAKAEPGFGPAFVEHGRALLLLGDAQGAEVSLAKGVQLLDAEPEAHSALGVALLATGKSEQALTSLTKARDLDPGSAARRGNLGTVLFMRSRVKEAIKEYEVQVQLAPDDARAHSDLGTALLSDGDGGPARAEAELRKAIAIDPRRATFRSNLGFALQLQGRTKDAVTEYREALRLDPKLVSAWVNLATVLARDPATRGEARKALETAAKLDPTDPRVKANLEELEALEKGVRRP